MHIHIKISRDFQTTKWKYLNTFPAKKSFYPESDIQLFEGNTCKIDVTGAHNTSRCERALSSAQESLLKLWIKGCKSISQLGVSWFLLIISNTMQHHHHQQSNTLQGHLLRWKVIWRTHLRVLENISDYNLTLPENSTLSYSFRKNFFIQCCFFHFQMFLSNKYIYIEFHFY